MQYVQLSADASKVIAWYACPQPITEDKPGYAEIADDDPRYAAWQSAQAAMQEALAAVNAGCQIVSTGTPALSGTYACDLSAQSKIQATALYIQVNGKFPAGKATMPWADIADAIHDFPTTAAFLAFATAIGDYVTEIEMVMLGQSTTLPAQPVTIA